MPLRTTDTILSDRIANSEAGSVDLVLTYPS